MAAVSSMRVRAAHGNSGAIQTRQFSGGAGRFFILILDNDRSIVK
jgi:hypothetical protein